MQYLSTDHITYYGCSLNKSNEGLMWYEERQTVYNKPLHSELATTSYSICTILHEYAYIYLIQPATYTQFAINRACFQNQHYVAIACM